MPRNCRLCEQIITLFGPCRKAPGVVRSLIKEDPVLQEWRRRAKIKHLSRGNNTDSIMSFNRFPVAPMMEWTDRHCRFFHRLLTRRARIYTEMITTAAVLHGDRARLLAYDPA